MGDGFEVLSQLAVAQKAINTAQCTKPLVSYDESSAPASTDVVLRELITDGIICSLRIPKTSKSTRPDGIEYEHFVILLTGGKTDFHLYNRKQCVGVGKKLSLMVSVWRKTMSDGRQFIYFDLHPTDKKPTHERKVWQDSTLIPQDLPEHTACFQCLGTEGTVGFLQLS